MTNEEAIKYFKRHLDLYCVDGISREAEEMAIQALSQEPITATNNNEPMTIIYPTIVCDDAISRESVDRILRDMGVHCAYDMPSFWANKGKDYKVIPTKWHKGYQQAVADFDKRIRELPPVTQKSGKWIKVKSGDKDFPESIVCSRCSNENSHLDFNENAEPIGKVFVTSKFCPNCGARMVEPQESEG